MDIMVLHPSPVLVVPPRARKPRVWSAETRTPVTLRRLDDGAAEVELAFGSMDSLERLAGEEGLWTPLTKPSSFGRMDLRPREFAAFLRGDEGFVHEDAFGELLRTFGRTPLVSVQESASPGRGNIGFSRGGVGDGSEADLGRVLHDSRERTPGELRAYLDGNVRLVGGRVYRRVEPLLRASLAGRADWARRWSIEVRADALQDGDYRTGPPALPVDGAEAALKAWYAHQGMDDIDWDEHARTLAAWDLPESRGIADVVDLAQRLPAYAERRLAALDRQFPEAAACVDEASRERIAGLARLGMVGAIPEAEAGGVACWLGAALVEYAEVADHVDTNDLHGIGSYVAHAMAPRLDAPAEIGREDGEALGGLAP